MRLEVQSSMPTMLPEVSFPLCSNYGENGSRYHTVVEMPEIRRDVSGVATIKNAQRALHPMHEMELCYCNYKLAVLNQLT